MGHLLVGEGFERLLHGGRLEAGERDLLVARLVRQRAEGIARARGCTNAYTDTFSFQAPGFWTRCGYKEFGRLEGMPAGHARIWFRKAL